MKGTVKIGAIRLEAVIDSEDPVVQQRCQEIVDASAERIEHAIGEAVCAELRRILPGITATTIFAGSEEEWDELGDDE